jgi:four helix bundle protein
MEKPKFNFEDLKVYQKALDFIDDVYDATETFPNMENYRLTSQFIRAANSIALNISEGSGSSDAMFNKYLQTAIDSVRECVTCSTIAFRRKYINEEINYNFRVQLAELSKMISSLQKYKKIKKMINSTNYPLPSKKLETRNNQWN